MAFNPLFLAAMADVKQEESGLASGLFNTSFMMGGALGLAILASLAASATAAAAGGAPPSPTALNVGYHEAFLLAGAATAVGAALGGFLLRVKAPTGDGPAQSAMH
jgi:hypothetical protein